MIKKSININLNDEKLTLKPVLKIKFDWFGSV